MIKTFGLRHIQINVQDAERALAFYAELFGVEEQFRSGDQTIFASIPGGGDLLTLHQPGASEPLYGRDRGGLVHFGFALPADADMDDAERQIIAAGGTDIRRGEHEPGKPFLYFHDLDGYEVELWTR
jgi:catechol 2,3-dioxygenase-like lactoylglutathione lyase family enzyme